MIKLVALDMDGTLLDSSKKLPEENRKTIEEYAKKGIHFAFCTGRVMNELELISGELPSVRYAITCNGAYVNDLTVKEPDNEIFEDSFTIEEVKELYYLIKNKGFDMMFELQADGVVYAQESCINDPDRYGVGYIRELIKETRVPVPNIEEFINNRTKNVGKTNIFFPTPEIRMQALEAFEGLDYDFAYSEPTNIDINKKGCHKGVGLVKLAEHLGLSMDEVMAIGDNFNDIEFLKTAGFSVVMANAPEEIKELADYVTLSNDESGVAYAIKKFCTE